MTNVKKEKTMIVRLRKEYVIPCQNFTKFNNLNRNKKEYLQDPTEYKLLLFVVESYLYLRSIVLLSTSISLMLQPVMKKMNEKSFFQKLLRYSL